jgi:hypothetical protein
MKNVWPKEWRRDAISYTTALWEDCYKDIYQVETTVTEVAPQEDVRPLDEYDKYNQEQSLLHAFSDEFDHFIHAAPVTLPDSSSALDWWLIEANRAAYPSLSVMAIDILSIPPMSAEPERIFSGARRTITWSRFRLGAGNIERMECLKSWIRTGLTAAWRSELVPETPETGLGNSTPCQDSR